MSKPGKVVLTVLLLAGFGAALYVALRGQKVEQEQRAEAAAIASATELKGLIALDVEPFFADPRVKRILAEKRLPVAVTRIGSREMAGKIWVAFDCEIVSHQAAECSISGGHAKFINCEGATEEE